MTTYEQNRSRYLAVPGGSIRILTSATCSCYPRDLTAADISHYSTGEDGTLWRHYRWCGVHQTAGAVSPEWTPEYGVLDDKEPAALTADSLEAIERCR